MKKIYFALPLLVALYGTGIVFSEDICTVSGEVVYSGDSTIYVLLLNSKTFAPAMGRQKELPPPEFVKVVKATSAGKASFAFKDVPKGEYVVRVFVDENNNGKPDVDTWGYPTEPVRSYKPPADGIHGNWYEQKFDADKDVTGIVVKLGE